MGKHAFTTILETAFQVPKVAAAVWPQSIKRAVAKQAVEIIRVIGLVAREKLAFPMAVKGVFPLR